MNKIKLIDMMEQILKNQAVLLACSQMNNTHDRESRAEFFDAAFKHASDTRFLLSELQKQSKKGVVVQLGFDDE